MMRACLFAAALVFFTTPGITQVLFRSEPEAWTFGVPDGIVGTHDDYPLAQLVVEMENVHGGTQAMRLDIGILGERKLTTGPVTVA